uniref:Putative YopX protein n=1 Tax=viral metagenome TaxID=1070528 RepID=A0A6M3IS57_9ZZZZ
MEEGEMRGIKFRAWNERIKKMENVINLDWFSEEGSLNKVDIITPLAQVRDELILIQYTGLHDKNGKEIWEGDICKNVDGEIGKVVFTNGAFWMQYIPPYDWDPMDPAQLLYNTLKIIGNIYENPELLKEGE